MGKIEENKEAKRRAIIGAARDVFLSDGFETANMDKIASLASVTKQTVYRYYASKLDLFEAAVRFMGQSGDANFVHHLENPDTKEALLRFAEGFIRWHLEDEPLRVFRLLVAESAKSPEIVRTFFSVAPDETNAALSVFFSDRLGVSAPEEPLRLWTAMLSAFRDEALFRMGQPDDEAIAQHANAATRFLLAGLGHSKAST